MPSSLTPDRRSTSPSTSSGGTKRCRVDTRTAVSSLFELQGATNANTAAVGAVLGTGLGLGTSSTGGFVLPSLGEWRAPGEVVRGDLAVRGLGTASLPDRATTLVVARHDEIDLVLEVTTSDLTLRPRYGLDPSLGLVDIAGDRVPFSTHGELATARMAERRRIGPARRLP